MQVVSVAGGTPTERTAVLEVLAERLASRGSVGTVTYLDDAIDVDADGTDTARFHTTGASETWGLVDDAGHEIDGSRGSESAGAWVATGDSRSLDDVLDELATRHHYAIVEGYAESALPTVALGDRDVTDPALERTDPDLASAEVLALADSPDDLDYDAVADAIDAQEPYRTLGSLVADVKQSPRANRAGAIATFTGRVRAKDDPDDVETTHLEFEKYDGVADAAMDSIRDDLESRDGVLAVRMHHRTGVVPAGEDVVFVVVLAGHRREAFRAVEDGIDRLKDEVPLFKKEVTVEDEFWRHERPDG